MNIHVEAINKGKQASYLSLFEDCFPHLFFSENYLKWLYFENPNGRVLGFDAVSKGSVVSHYACIPISVGGRKGLLSLNTGTSREFQSKGLFTQLATRTIEEAGHHYDFIVGVANQNSTEGFTRRLGFEILGCLNLRYGPLFDQPLGTVDWNYESLKWRLSNPLRAYSDKKVGNDTYQISARLPNLPIKVHSIVSIGEKFSEGQFVRNGFTIDWGTRKSKSISLPNRLKPVPLNLILKNLKSDKVLIEHWDFLGFDVI